MSKNLLACLVAGFSLACSHSPTAPEVQVATEASAPQTAPTAPTNTEGVPKSAGIQGGNAQTAVISTAVPNGLAVWVVDGLGKPVADAPVTFTVTAGGGTIAAATVRTNASGVASSGKWTLGTSVGTNSAVAKVDGRDLTVGFVATAVPPTAAVSAPQAIAVIDGNGQTVPAGRGARADINLRVTDAAGNPFPNATVSLTAGNGGNVSPASVTTNASGVATVRGWTLGPLTGTQTLVARVTTGSVNPSTTVTANATTVRIITFGDSNTDLGYAGIAPQFVAVSYISVNPPRPAASAANHSTQLAGKIENRWFNRYSAAIMAVNHAIGGTTSGSVRSQYGSPSALTVVNGITRFDGEVLGAGYPWNGGEAPSLFYTGPIARTKAFTPTVNDFVYVSIGTNDEFYGISPTQTLANINSMIDRWLAKGLPADHFIVTTLAPSPGAVSGQMPSLNAGIRALASQRGVKVIDLAGYVSPDNGLTWKSQALVIQDGIGAHYVESVRDWLADQVATLMGAATAPR